MIWTTKQLLRKGDLKMMEPNNGETGFFEWWRTELTALRARRRERMANERKMDPEKSRAILRRSYYRNVDKRREDARIQREKLKLNPEKLAAHNAKRNARRRELAKLDPQYRFRRQIRTRIWMAIHKAYGKKAHRTFELIGCSREEFMKHIESTWTDGMSWETTDVADGILTTKFHASNSI
jgi:hypothetical protein